MPQYKINPGDTLSGIAKQYNTNIATLQQLNPTITDPNKIFAGQSLILPESKTYSTIAEAPTIGGFNTVKDFLTTTTPTEPINAQTLAGNKEEIITPPADTSQNNPTPVIIDRTADIQARLDAMAKAEADRQAKIEADLAAAQAENKSLTTKLGEFFTGQKTREQQIADLEAKYQLPETFATQKANLETMKGLREQINTIETEKQNALATLEARSGVPRGIMGVQTTELERQYAVREAGLSAQLAALSAYDQTLQGNITQAVQLMGNYIDAYTYDTNLKLKEFDTFLGLNKDTLSTLSAGEKDSLDNQRTLLLQQYTDQMNEAKAIADLVTNNPNINWSGFDFSKGTLAQANQIVAQSPNKGKMTAPNSLDDLAKLGYARRGSASGIGWDFYKNGKPITAEKISQETGVSLATLLAGSTNPADIEKMGTAAVKEANLTSQQQGWINEAKASLDAVKQMYGDAVSMRDALIERYKQQYNFDLSPYF